ncbi:unnamed protein product [Musa acuminata subsp. burmannicoides]
MARAGGITNAVNVGIAVQADWENREFISNISLNVRRLFDFLLQFGTSLVLSSLPTNCCCGSDPVIFIAMGCFIFVMRLLKSPDRDIPSRFCASPEATTKSKLAALNEKLDILEHRLEVLEVKVSSATTNPSVFT